MLGWLADFLRFAWALLYWNIRKSWFQWRRGRSPCPCQAPSDSGKAYETRCDACIHWHRPERFRRVCPLLVATPDGLRCSANTPEVRPFWGITIRYYGGTLLAVYAAAVLTVFGFLRVIGYPVSIVHVALPPLWHKVGQARDWYYLQRAREAFAAGRTNEGLLYLENSYEFDPTNYEAGLALAKNYQLSRPARSDEIFAQLLAEHPEHRDATAQQWVLALVARGDFEHVASVSANEVRHSGARASPWMRALIFATRQSHDSAPLRTLRANLPTALGGWRQLLDVELLWESGQRRETRAALNQPWPEHAPAYTIIYRTELLTALGDPGAALDFLVAQRAQLDDEAYWTVRFHCLAVAGATRTLESEFQSVLLAPPINQPRLKMMCAQLIRHPNRAMFQQVFDKVHREQMAFNDATAGGWFSLLCTAGAVGDDARLHALALQLRQGSQTPFSALMMVEAFFLRHMTETRATVFLPYLPVPLEICYALIERYPGPVAPSIVVPATS